MPKSEALSRESQDFVSANKASKLYALLFLYRIKNQEKGTGDQGIKSGKEIRLAKKRKLAQNEAKKVSTVHQELILSYLNFTAHSLSLH